MQSFKVDQLEVRVYEDRPALAQDAAFVVCGWLTETLSRQKSGAAILATGNSQIQFLDALVRMGKVDWARMTLFHMDEYLGIAPDHRAGFAHYMRERVEQRVRPGKFNYLDGQAMEPLDECRRYTELLKKQPLDLCCMGIGENGHLAFNDPPVADFEDEDWVKIVKLDDACKMQQVREGHFPEINAVPPYAYTLTIPTLFRPRHLLCIAPETRKAKALRDALRGPIDPACPASALRRQPHAILMLDRESASLL